MMMSMSGGYGYGGGYGRASSLEDLMMIALILAIVGTILSFIFITPLKKRAQLPKFFQIVHDVFNFNGLIIEKILKAIYIFETLYIILTGLVMLIEGAEFLPCLLIIVLGPVLIRVIFELIMMSVLLVKNVIQINKKLQYQNDTKEKDGFDFDYTKYTTKEEKVESAPEATYSETAAYCPQCGSAVTTDSAFCPNCGQSIQ